MGLFKHVARGASTQFGREFGRAAANAILQGSNYYAIKGAKQSSPRRRQALSPIEKAISDIERIDFVSQNKANVNRLINITNIASSVFNFNGLSTLDNMDKYSQLLTIYNDKFNHGAILIDDNYNDKSVDFLTQKVDEFMEQIRNFYSDYRYYIHRQYDLYNKAKRDRKKALIWAFPIWGIFGLHHTYLGNKNMTIMSILFCWTFVFLILNIIDYFKLLAMSDEKFDLKYNPMFAYYKALSQHDHEG